MEVHQDCTGRVNKDRGPGDMVDSCTWIPGCNKDRVLRIAVPRAAGLQGDYLILYSIFLCIRCCSSPRRIIVASTFCTCRQSNENKSLQGF